MKLASLKTELKALITLSNGDDKSQSFLLARLSADHFSLPEHNDIFQRIKILAESEEGIPDSSLLAEDLGLAEESRVILKSSKVTPTVYSKIKSLSRTLTTYKKVRAIHKHIKRTADVLKGELPSSQFDEVISDLLDNLAKEKSDVSSVHFSTQSNNKGNIKRILDEKLNLVPTGWDAFDSRNGGFPVAGLVILAANSGGGKTVTALQLAINQYKMGYSPLIVSFEMDYDELWARTISNYCNVPFSAVFQKKLTPKQKKIIWKKMKEFYAIGEEKKCNFSLLCPDQGLSFSELMYLINHKEKDILYIDYISLLNPEREDHAQFRQLQEISRLAKLAAKKLQIPIVLLAQLNAEDNVKYSGGINENANLTIIWRRDAESREAREIEMRITKARNQEAFPFILAEQFDVMRLGDVASDRRKAYTETTETEFENSTPVYKDVAVDLDDDDNL